MRESRDKSSSGDQSVSAESIVGELYPKIKALRKALKVDLGLEFQAVRMLHQGKGKVKYSSTSLSVCEVYNSLQQVETILVRLLEGTH